MIALVLAVLPSAFHFQASGSQERLYVTSPQALYVLDGATGVVQESSPVPGTQFLWSLAHDGARLLSIDRTVGGVEDELFSIHPANADGTMIGLTGHNWDRHGMDVHPSTGVAYVFFLDEVYAVDAATGALGYVGWLDGLLPLDCICTFAFTPNGLGWGVGYSNGVLYSIDLTSMQATVVGVIQEVADGVGDFWDLAVDSSGQLWGVYSGGTNGTPRGVYTIDTSNLTIQLVVQSFIYEGIAFGPATPETFYCTPKANSLGCVPTLEATGLASPTASSGYRVTATNVRNRTFGRLLYTVNGAASNPFAGGTLCLNTPWKGTPIVSSGGTPKPAQDCSGVWTADLNTELTAKPGPQAGDTLHCQWIGRDPGFAPPDNYSLTSALELTLLP